jgi:hypothetical protein
MAMSAIGTKRKSMIYERMLAFGVRADTKIRRGYFR